MTDLVDVIEVQIKPPHEVRVLERNCAKVRAEFIVEMAVRRRGVDRSFFTTTPAGRYQDGNTIQVETPPTQEPPA